MVYHLRITNDVNTEFSRQLAFNLSRPVVNASSGALDKPLLNITVWIPSSGRRKKRSAVRGNRTAKSIEYHLPEIRRRTDCVWCDCGGPSCRNEENKVVVDYTIANLFGRRIVQGVREFCRAFLKHDC